MNENFISKKRKRKLNSTKEKMNKEKKIYQSTNLNQISNVDALNKKFSLDKNSKKKNIFMVKKKSGENKVNETINLNNKINRENINQNKLESAINLKETSMSTKRHSLINISSSNSKEVIKLNSTKNKEYDFETILPKNLKYEIESWSSYNFNFHPKNICIDSKTSGALSKWSVDFKSQNEFIYLKLEKTSIVTLITFGKFRDPTNLKEFKIYAGLDKNDMIEILHSGLTYDMEYEPFSVRREYKGNFIPCNYLKLIPIRPWDDNYHISVWFINLKGIDDSNIIQRCVKDFNNLKNREKKLNWLNLTRFIFKQNTSAIFQIDQINNVLNSLEDRNITNLFNEIISGDYENAINTIKILSKNNSFESYINDLPYKVYFKRLDYLSDEINNLFTKINLSIKNESLLLREKKYSIDSSSKGYSKQISKKLEEEEKKELDNNIVNFNNIQIRPYHENSYSNQNNNNDNRSEINARNSIDNSNEENLENLGSLFSQYDLSEDSMLNLNENNTDEYGLEKNEINYPCGRGGHAMTLDENNSLIYLFGGWDGKEDLDDFWCYDIMNEEWNLISSSTKEDNGPCARSCHRMVFDNMNNKIYIYGRVKITNENKNNKMYEYDVCKGKWSTLIITKQKNDRGEIFEGGPGQVYDHQMCIDAKNQKIYIFGGISIPDKKEEENQENNKYLGLWNLDLKTKIWQNLLNEVNLDEYNIKLKTRTGHTMLFDPIKQELIILGGQKIIKKKNDSTYHLFDIMIYDIKSKILKEMSHDYSREKGPNVNIALNAFYNYINEEILFFGGGFKSDKMEIVSNNFWLLKIESKKWEKIKKSEIFINYDGITQDDLKVYYEKNKFLYKTEKINTFLGRTENDIQKTNLSRNVNELNFQDAQLNEPFPRFAHTMVYSLKLNRGFIFGGNPNIKSGHTVRYNDFWSYSYYKSDNKEIKNILKLKILKLSFIENCLKNNLNNALKDLKRIREIKSTNNEEFKELIRFIIQPSKEIELSEVHKYRIELFDEIKQYLNEFN